MDYKIPVITSARAEAFATKIVIVPDMANSNLAIDGEYIIEITSIGDVTGTYRVINNITQKVIGEYTVSSSVINNIIPGFSLTITSTFASDIQNNSTMVGDYVIVVTKAGTTELSPTVEVITEREYTITIDFVELKNFVDSLPWEENKYCHVYGLNEGYISKEAFVHFTEGLKNLLTNIENNIETVKDYIVNIEAMPYGKLIVNSGYTIAIAGGLSEIVPDTSESWKVLELRIRATGDYTGEIKFFNRIKSK
jgi:hypothetical protein